MGNWMNSIAHFWYLLQNRCSTIEVLSWEVYNQENMKSCNGEEVKRLQRIAGNTGGNEMINWNNLDKSASFKEVGAAKKVDLKEVMAGEEGAKRVRKYSAPMAAGLQFNYAAKQVDDNLLEAFAKWAKEAQLLEKYAAL